MVRSTLLKERLKEVGWLGRGKQEAERVKPHQIRKVGIWTLHLTIPLAHRRDPKFPLKPCLTTWYRIDYKEMAAHSSSRSHTHINAE